MAAKQTATKATKTDAKTKGAAANKALSAKVSKPAAAAPAARLAQPASHKTPAAEAAAKAIAAGLTPAISREESAPMTPKNFRNHPDMENFFRFIYENDLRIEALHIIDEIIVQRLARRKKGPATASAGASANA